MLSAFIAAIHECCGLDAETFSTATFAGHIGVAEAKCLVEPFLDEVNLGAINERKAVFVHHNFDAVILEDDIEIINLICIVDDIGEAITAGLFDAQSQADAATPGVEMGSDSLGSGLGQ
jgi:hypothetical protein